MIQDIDYSCIGYYFDNKTFRAEKTITQINKAEPRCFL